jgi:hypothetical protein
MKTQEWVVTRKKLLNRIKAQVYDRLGESPIALRQYAKKLAREFNGRWRACAANEFLRSVSSAHVIFGSDFHAYAQSQRAHVRILRSVAGRRPIVLALECLAQEDQDTIDAYLKNAIDESEFLRSTKWTEFWGFPWLHYKPLFELAKKHGFVIIALSRRTDATRPLSLQARDRRMAKDLLTCQAINPDSLIYVLVGEFHLAQSHLPNAWEVLSGDDNYLIVHQDAETLYFRLAEQARDQSVDILRRGNSFCLMVSPPWVKWQSYLMFLEQIYDRDLDEDGGSIDYSDHVKTLVDVLARDLELKVETSGLQVYTPASKETLKNLKKNLPRKFWPLLQYHLTNDRCFLLPEKGLVYLSSPTLNRAAGLAGEFLHVQISGRKTLLWDGLKDFDALIWIETIAFFFSKWINPNRKSETQDTLRFQLVQLSPRDRGREALLLALDQRLSDVLFIRNGRRRPLRLRPRKKLVILEAARILGGILGDRLFAEVRSKNLKLSEVCDWLRFPVESEEFGEFYRRLLKRLQ